MDRVENLNRLLRAESNRMRRPLRIRRRGRTIEVRLHSAIEIVALSEAADKHDAANQPAFGPYALDLPLNEINYFLHHRVKDLLDLFCAHD